MRIINTIRKKAYYLYYFKYFDYKIKNEKYPFLYKVNFDKLASKLNQYNISSKIIHHYSLGNYKYYEFYVNHFFQFYNIFKKILMLFFIIEIIFLISRPLVSVK